MATNYSVKIAGSLVNAMAGSLNVQNQIGQRSTGSLQVWSNLGVSWQRGTSVRVFDLSNALVFSGFTTKDKVVKVGSRQGQGFLEHNLQLMDNAYLADKRSVWQTYLNMSAGAIAQDLVGRVLTQEGVTYTATSIAAGPTIPEVIWNGKQVSAALTWLAQQSGYWWNITNDGTLFFQPYGGVPAPFVLDGTQVESGTAGGLSVTYGNDLYVNTQFTQGRSEERRVGKEC